jgi:hypothetical protein
VDGHDTFEIDVYGMQHVPEAAVHEYMEMHGMGDEVQRAKKARNDEQVAARQEAVAAAAAAAPTPQMQMHAPPPQGQHMFPGAAPHAMHMQGGYSMPMVTHTFQPPMRYPPHAGAFQPQAMQPPAFYPTHDVYAPRHGMYGPPQGGMHQTMPPQPYGVAPHGFAPPSHPFAGHAHAGFHAGSSSGSIHPHGSYPIAAPVAPMPVAQPSPPPPQAAASNPLPSQHPPPSTSTSAAPAAVPAAVATPQTAPLASKMDSGGGGGIHTHLSPAAFGRHAVAVRDTILVYGDDLLSPEERRAAMPRYRAEGEATTAADKLQSLGADLEGRLAQALG